jgi:hypothetical protein
MCINIPDAIPRPRLAASVLIDFSSPCCAPNSFSAPQPTSLPSMWTDQNVISSYRNPSKSNACTLSSDETDFMSTMCCARNCAISSPDQS